MRKRERKVFCLIVKSVCSLPWPPKKNIFTDSCWRRKSLENNFQDFQARNKSLRLVVKNTFFSCWLFLSLVVLVVVFVIFWLLWRDFFETCWKPLNKNPSIYSAVENEWRVLFSIESLVFYAANRTHDLLFGS